MDGIPYPQTELLLALERKRRAIIASGNSLLPCSNAVVSQLPGLSVDLLLQRPSSMSSTVASTDPSSPRPIVGESGMSSKFPLLTVDQLPSREPLGAAGSASSMAGAAGGIEPGTNQNVSPIIDGLVRKLQVELLTKLSTPQEYSSPSLPVHRGLVDPATISAALQGSGSSMMVSAGAAPSTNVDHVAHQIISQLIKKEQEREALHQRLRTLPLYRTAGGSNSIPQSVPPLLSTGLGDVSTTNTALPAIMSPLISQSTGGSFGRQQSQIALMTSPAPLQGHLGRDPQVNPGTNCQSPASSLSAHAPSSGTSLAPSSMIISPSAQNVVERLQFRAPPRGKEDCSGAVKTMAGMQQGTRTSLFPNNKKDAISDKSFDGDPIIPLALDTERGALTEYQYLFRRQLVFVVTRHPTMGGRAQGRSKPVSAGQVGILCCHCARLPPMSRTPGAVYYPAKLDRIYQAAVNMAINHFENRCPAIPERVREELKALKNKKVVNAGGGKKYWADAALQLGVREGEDGLFLERQPHNNNKRGIEQISQL